MTADTERRYAVPPGLSLSRQPCWCGSTDLRVFATLDRWNQPLQSMLCSSCGTLQLNPRMTKSQAASFYNSLYPERQDRAEDFFENQRKTGAGDYVRRFVTPGMTVLDYGCGPGGKLVDLISTGATVVGYDLNDAYQSFAVSKGLRPYRPDQKVDAVYLSHTVEHWIEPLNDLRDIVDRHLNPGGLLIVEVPLLNRLLIGCRPGVGIRGDIYLPHTWYFSVGTMDRLMGRLPAARIYTDHTSVSVYRVGEPGTAPDNKAGFSDWILRFGASVLNKGPLPRVAGKINRTLGIIKPLAVRV